MSIFNMIPISPMLCKPLDISRVQSMDDSEHIFELKLDGARCIGFVDRDETLLQNRRGLNITFRYPELKIKLKPGYFNGIFDGELVCFDEDGHPSFNALQHREHVTNPAKIKILVNTYKAYYVIFDVLFLNDKDITHLPLIERKAILKDVLDETENVTICDYITGGEGKGKRYLDEILKRELEGVIVKNINSKYIIGKRSDKWIKLKKEDTIEGVIVGITEGEGSRSMSLGSFGALVIAAYNSKKELQYLAKAGSGLKDKDIKLFNELFKDVPVLEKSPLVKVPDKLRREKVIWLKPLLVAEIEFMEVTKSSKLRSPRFLRLRTDKLPEECVIE